MPNLRYTITSGTPSESEQVALEAALGQHMNPAQAIATKKSIWASPQLRAPLRKNS